MRRFGWARSRLGEPGAGGTNQGMKGVSMELRDSIVWDFCLALGAFSRFKVELRYLIP